MHRLTRLGELFGENPVYFVTACTEHRRRLLDNPGTHDAFRNFCHQARTRGVLVGKYVLMPDHLHMFVCIPTGAVGLSRWMKSLKNALSKHWREQEIPSPHWQKGFFDHLIRKDESHAEKWNYMADNPVRAGLCSAPSDWAYGGDIHPPAPI